jgi:cupin superfamily acireductone dioxygenase involved in methionine salvage
MPENYKETSKFIKMCFQLLKQKTKEGDFITIKRESYAKAGKRKEYLDNLYNTTIKNLNLKTGYYNGIFLNISEEIDWGSTKTF